MARRGILLRRWLRALHRDVGYLCAGMTVLYAVSGVAVDHVDSWNPNYVVSRARFQVTPRPESTLFDAERVQELLREAGQALDDPSLFRRDPRTLQILGDGISYTLDLPSGLLLQERVAERPLLFPANFLHLNHAKGWWSWVADLFAVSLAFLALSGLFILGGRQGLLGRGWWLTSIGILVPVIGYWAFSS